MDKEIKIIKEEKTKKNKLNKKGIILLSIISGVLLLSIILVFVFTTIFFALFLNPLNVLLSSTR